MSKLQVDKPDKAFSLVVTITDVRKEVVNGRPQIVVDCEDEAGREFSHALSLKEAREITRKFGPHPLVEEFFRDGGGVQ